MKKHTAGIYINILFDIFAGFFLMPIDPPCHPIARADKATLSPDTTARYM
jgi:hypothetical protein